MACVSGEIAYDEITVNTPVTAVSFAVTELARITIPPLPFPAYLSFEVWAAADVATVAAVDPINTKAVCGILPASELASPTAVLNMLAFDRYGTMHAATAATGVTNYDRYLAGLPTEGDNGMKKLRATGRLGANQPGDYILGGCAVEGASRLWHVVANTGLYIGRMWATRGR
jgi:hypothetical protein